MANTINANIQNNIIAQSALEQFTKILAPLSSFSTSFNDEAAQKGATISITNISNTSVADDFDPTTGYVQQDTTYGASKITLNSHKFVAWHITDTESAESSAVELQRFGYQMGGDLAKAIFDEILGAVTAANYAATPLSTTAANFDAADVTSLRESGLDAGMFPDQCSLVLDSSYFTYLLQDTALIQAMNYGSAEVIQGGRVPSLYGIKQVRESPNIPANGGEALAGFYCHPSCMAVAMRYLQPVNAKEYIAARRLTDADTGMVLGYREYYDPALGQQNAVLEAVYGQAVGVAGNLIRIVTP